MASEEESIGDDDVTEDKTVGKLSLFYANYLWIIRTICFIFIEYP